MVIPTPLDRNPKSLKVAHQTQSQENLTTSSAPRTSCGILPTQRSNEYGQPYELNIPSRSSTQSMGSIPFQKSPISKHSLSYPKIKLVDYFNADATVRNKISVKIRSSKKKLPLPRSRSEAGPPLTPPSPNPPSFGSQRPSPKYETQKENLSEGKKVLRKKVAEFQETIE
jgi:hypothetical protein